MFYPALSEWYGAVEAASLSRFKQTQAKHSGENPKSAVKSPELFHIISIPYRAAILATSSSLWSSCGWGVSGETSGDESTLPPRHHQKVPAQLSYRRTNHPTEACCTKRAHSRAKWTTVRSRILEILFLSSHSARLCAASPLRRPCLWTAVLADAFVKVVVAEAVAGIVRDIAADTVADQWGYLYSILISDYWILRIDVQYSISIRKVSIFSILNIEYFI